MNQREKLIVKYTEELRAKFNIEPEMDLLTKVTIGLGPSIYTRDRATVSSSDEKELQRIKDSFLIKKLKIDENEDLDTPIANIIEQYGKTVRTKYRAVIYYLLVKHFSKEAIY